MEGAGIGWQGLGEAEKGGKVWKGLERNGKSWKGLAGTGRGLEGVGRVWKRLKGLERFGRGCKGLERVRRGWQGLEEVGRGWKRLAGTGRGCPCPGCPRSPPRGLPEPVLPVRGAERQINISRPVGAGLGPCPCQVN